jgi:hypothetical protein
VKAKKRKKRGPGMKNLQIRIQAQIHEAKGYEED